MKYVGTGASIGAFSGTVATKNNTRYIIGTASKKAEQAVKKRATKVHRTLDFEHIETQHSSQSTNTLLK